MIVTITSGMMIVIVIVTVTGPSSIARRCCTSMVLTPWSHVQSPRAGRETPPL